MLLTNETETLLNFFLGDTQDEIAELEEKLALANSKRRRIETCLSQLKMNVAAHENAESSNLLLHRQNDELRKNLNESESEVTRLNRENDELSKLITSMKGSK